MQPSYTSKLSSRTVLIRAVPENYLDEVKLRQIFGSHVVRVWFPTDANDLKNIVDGLGKIATVLEDAETNLIRKANKARIKLKEGASSQHDNNNAIPGGEIESGSIAARWITPDQRPTHRTRFLSGEKVDTINWARTALQKILPIVQAEQEKHRLGQAKKIRAVFIEFDSLREAQAAYQSLTHHQVFKMSPRFTGMHPTDIIWFNLRMRGWEQYMRFAASLVFVVGLIAFWAVPVAAVRAISNAAILSKNGGWLEWLKNANPHLRALITGVLPSLLLTILMDLVPIVLRFVAKLGGSPTYSDVESTVQNYYFAFQLIQAFLVSSIGSAVSILGAAGNISQVPAILATGLPLVSNLFMSYTILQGVGVFAYVMIGFTGTVVTPIVARIVGSPPRKLFLAWNRLAGVSWGTLYPKYTNLFVIGEYFYKCIII
jgi:hypothetical protein